VVATHAFHAATTVPFLGDGQVVQLFAWPYDPVMVGAAFLWAVPRVSARRRLIGIVAIYMPLALVLDALLSGAYDARPSRLTSSCTGWSEAEGAAKS
jgi:di/tricarboxylate transporter